MGFTHFGGPRQRGGPVRPDAAYLVGEAGPELFVPNTSGAIVPGRTAAAPGGGRVVPANVIINNNTPARVETQQDQQTGNLSITIDEMMANNTPTGHVVLARAARPIRSLVHDEAVSWRCLGRR
jgi:hypothetical protein